jgi:hypothetical protein
MSNNRAEMTFRPSNHPTRREIVAGLPHIRSKEGSDR